MAAPVECRYIDGGRKSVLARIHSSMSGYLSYTFRALPRLGKNPRHRTRSERYARRAIRRGRSPTPYIWARVIHFPNPEYERTIRRTAINLHTDLESAKQFATI